MAQQQTQSVTTTALIEPFLTLTSSSGMAATFTRSGCLSRLAVGDISLLLFPATAMEPGPANLWLRRHEGDRVDWTPFLGPASPSVVQWTDSGLVVSGTWGSLSYVVRFRLGEAHPVWYWFVTVVNAGAEPATVDVVLTHDPALTWESAVRTNEYYISQYLDISPVPLDGADLALAVRQNMPGPLAPWAMVGSLRSGQSWASDAWQLMSPEDRGRFSALGQPRLPSRRLQHEHALLALQDAVVTLAPGEQHDTGFFGIFVPDHGAATGPDDARWATIARSQPETEKPADSEPATTEPAHPVVDTAFATPRPLPIRALTEDELNDLAGGVRVHQETDGDTVLSFFGADGAHVVMAEKERRVLRPHGHILRTGAGLTPDTGTLTSTVWMRGTFHSQVTQGHVGRRTLLSPRRSYVNLQQGHGMRLFVASSSVPGAWELLDMPSAFVIHFDRCVWRYAATDGLVVQVTSRAPSERHELTLEVEFLAGAPREVLVAMDTARGGDGVASPVLVGDDTSLTIEAGDPSTPGSLRVRWDGTTALAVAGDELLFADGQPQGSGWVSLRLAPARKWDLTLSADTIAPQDVVQPEPEAGDPATFWSRLGGAVTLTAPESSALFDEVTRMQSILGWFAHDALVHYLSPRGLEQFSGGGWGTRDVCQGPIGLLTALGRTNIQRDVLLRVLRAQNARGDWPQAFEFLPPIPNAGQRDSHGDVVFWPVLAVGEYLQATGDTAFLAEAVPFVGDTGPTADFSVEEHLRRAVRRIMASTIEPSPLPVYGHGDWNDSLQPADPRMAATMASVWTAVLQVQALRALAAGLRDCGVAGDLADDCADLAGRTHASIQDLLQGNDLLPGYLLFHDDGSTERLVHPDDTVTGLRYGVLPWIHAISADLLTPAQARHHLAMIDEHLRGPDGARLFDRPARYAGGPMAVFQRAEAATFWGREIGLMYTHAHLRYAEALARVGDGPALFAAMNLANPIGITERVPQARPRQSTCYYSSSDGVFADRYEAASRYGELMAGGVDLEGGWRVYSSGPGLFLRLLVECVLGVRQRGAVVELDPVLDPRLDGLRAQVPLGADGTVRLVYRVGTAGHGVRRVTVAGQPLATSSLVNPYRAAGVRVDLSVLRDAMSRAGGIVELEVETA